MQDCRLKRFERFQINIHFVFTQHLSFFFCVLVSSALYAIEAYQIGLHDFKLKNVFRLITSVFLFWKTAEYSELIVLSCFAFICSIQFHFIICQNVVCLSPSEGQVVIEHTFKAMKIQISQLQRTGWKSGYETNTVLRNGTQSPVYWIW